MTRLDSSQLKVESFHTSRGGGEQQIQSDETLWASTGYCCDTLFDCSSACRQPTNVCQVCG
jgi:hypothetical protein